MATYKVTYIFNVCRQGWSETWYTTHSTVSAARTAAYSVAIKRATLLGKPVILEAMRISDVEIPRQCGLETLGAFGYSTSLVADTPWNAWLSEFRTADDYCRSYLLRGMPDDWIARNPIDANLCRYLLDPTLNTLFVEFRQSLIVNGFQLRVIQHSPPAPGPITIGALSLATGGYTQALITGLIGAEGKTVRFSDYSGFDKKTLNGVHKIRSNSGTAVVIDLKWSDIIDPPSNFGGKAWAQIIDYRTVNYGELVRPAKKSTGRAFFVPRGRSAARS